MDKLNGPADRVKYYLAQAREAEEKAAKCADVHAAERFQHIAGQWRDMVKNIH